MIAFKQILGIFLLLMAGSIIGKNTNGILSLNFLAALILVMVGISLLGIFLKL